MKWFLIFCTQLVCKEGNKIVIKKTINSDLNIILENYEKKYYSINNTKGPDNTVSRYNTISIINDCQNKIKNRIENLYFIQKDYIKIILALYLLIKNTKENPEENYYEKILSHIQIDKNDNKNIQLNQNECEKILLLINTMSLIIKPYFFNLNNIGFHTWLGDSKDSLLKEINKYKSTKEFVSSEIKRILKSSENVSVKKILDDAIYFFDNIGNNYKNFQSAKKILISEINQLESKIKNEQDQKKLIEENNYREEWLFQKPDKIAIVDLLNNNIEMLTESTKKKKTALDIIEELKKLYSKAVNIKKDADTVSWYNIIKNMQIIKAGREIINKANKLNLELEALGVKFTENKSNNYDKKSEINHNAIEITKLLKELSNMIYEKRNIYSNEIIDLVDKITININDFKNNEDVLPEDKKNIDKVMDVIEVLKLIKRPSQEYQLTKNDLYSNYILFILFFSNNNEEEKLKKIMTVLNHTKIDMKKILLDQKNLFFTFLSMITNYTDRMGEEVLKKIQSLLLKINSYIGFSMVLAMLDPKKSIEDTFIYQLYNIVSRQNKKNILLTKNLIENKIPGVINNRMTLTSFGGFLFEKSRLFIKSIYSSLFKRPIIVEDINIKNDYNNNENDDKKSISTEDSDLKIHSDIFPKIHNENKEMFTGDISLSQFNRIIEKENNNKNDDEEIFYDVDESLWDKIIEKENINNNIIK
jgi:hypothetical protein